MKAEKEQNLLTGSSEDAVSCIKKRKSEGSCSLSGEAEGVQAGTEGDISCCWSQIICCYISVLLAYYDFLVGMLKKCLVLYRTMNR